MLNIALLKHADILITPDTYIVHAASAFDKKQIFALYQGNDLDVWYPLTKNYNIIVPDKDFNDFDVKELIKNLL